MRRRNLIRSREYRDIVGLWRVFLATKIIASLVPVALGVWLLTAPEILAAPMDQDVFTNFESINTVAPNPFDVGTGSSN
jgi:hypothetical protein